MSDTQEPIDNHLLAALADADLQRLKPHLELVDLKLGQVLYEPCQAHRHAYFPTSAVVSRMHILSDGSTAETSVVGNDGIVGVALILGGTSTPGYGSVLIAGQGYRIGAQRITEAFDRSASIRRVLLRYAQTLVAQIAQTVLCNRYHTVDQRLCGWLLHRLDRLSDNDVAVTQDLIATMLGVRRESVTEAAGRLQAAGLIHHWRGHVTVLDRDGLERRSCECHAVVKQEYDRLLPPDVALRPALPHRSAWRRQRAPPRWPTAGCKARLR